MTVQPTEQCVHTDFLISILPPEAAWAFALRTIPKLIVEAAAREPAARPERFRKVRRSIALPTKPASAFDKRGPFATPFVLRVSIDLS